MKQKDDNKHDKPARPNDKSSKVVPMGIMFVVLCGFSFYLGGIFCSNNNGFMSTEEVVKSVESPQKTISTPVQMKSVSFPQCSADMQDYTPCTDPKRWMKYGRHSLTFMERHCPPAFDRKVCLVPPPDGYKEPIRWPKSKNECWNVSYDWINKQKSNQHWLRKEGEKFYFSGGGTNRLPKSGRLKAAHEANKRPHTGGSISNVEHKTRLVKSKPN